MREQQPPRAALGGAERAPSTTTDGISATAPGQRVPRAALEAANAQLRSWVRGPASDPGNPWALAHALVAFGPKFRTSDGRQAVEVLMGDHAVRDAGGGWSFPKRTAAGVVADVHTDLIVKAMLEAGVPATQAFPRSGGASLRLEDFLVQTRKRQALPRDDRGWRDYAWTYLALLEAGEPVPTSIREGLFSYVEQQQAFIGELLDQGRPEALKKRKQLVFAHTCGGLHLIQAALAGASGISRSADRARRQVEIVLFRWRAEKEIYAQMKVRAPQYTEILTIQELKFFGHVLETLALAKRQGIFGASAADRDVLDNVVRDVLATVRALEPSYGALAEVRKRREQSYLDLIGDGCHTIRGLSDAIVAFWVPQ